MPQSVTEVDVYVLDDLPTVILNFVHVTLEALKNASRIKQYLR